MNEINWGIIGCGDVAEVKSGPAFQKVPHSNLISVMRRNEEKAKDFAKRHHVPQWTSNAEDILNNDDINAVYILGNSTGKLTMAHYRRKLPAFLKVKELLDTNSIGDIIHVDLQVLQSKKKCS